MSSIPYPSDQPVLSLWPTTGQILGLGRSSTFEAARRGEIPTLKFGRRLMVPTAQLRRMLGLDVDQGPPDAERPAAARPVERSQQMARRPGGTTPDRTP